MTHDVRHLVFKRGTLPKASEERLDVEESIRFIYRWQSDEEFQCFLILTDCAAMIGRAVGWVLVALGLNRLRWKMVERLKGAY